MVVKNEKADFQLSDDAKDVRNLILGIVCGIVATGPMTVLMIMLHRRLPAEERYALPPREITMKLARESGIAGHLSAGERDAATLVAHFGYGGAAGALYSAMAVEKKPANGLLFGMFLWLISYLGLLPGAGILRSAIHHPLRRNLLMIAAHLVWGGTLGWLMEALLGDQRRRSAPALGTSELTHRDAT